MAKANASLSPSDNGSAYPVAQRPITVMPPAHKLWAPTTLRQFADWQGNSCLSTCVGSANTVVRWLGFWQISMRVEEVDAAATPLFGFSMGIAKALDCAPRPVMFHLAAPLGLPMLGIGGLQAVCSLLGRRLNFGILGNGTE